MKMILIVGLLALVGCVGNKPVVEEMNTNNLLCEKIMKLPIHLIEYAEAMASDDVQEFTRDGEYVGKVFCQEKAVCNNVNYCVSIKSSTEINSIFDIPIE
jgi:hypothetical protein